MDCTCGSEEKQKKRAVKARRRYEQLRRQHKKLLGVAIELTQVLEEYVRGQRTPNISETLTLCSKIYPSLFDELSARTRNMAIEKTSKEQRKAEKEVSKSMKNEDTTTYKSLTKDLEKMEDEARTKIKSTKESLNIKKRKNLQVSEASVNQAENMNLRKKAEEKLSKLISPSGFKELQERTQPRSSHGKEETEKFLKVAEKVLNEDETGGNIIEDRKSGRRQIKKELLELAEEDYFDGFWSKKELPRTPANPALDKK